MMVRLAPSDRAPIIVFMTIVSIKADIVICPSAVIFILYSKNVMAYL